MMDGNGKGWPAWSQLSGDGKAIWLIFGLFIFLTVGISLGY
jgi:hypothetical protein